MAKIMVNLTVAAAVALFLYEVFLTSDREVQSYWTTKQTGASLLFFANKWISVTCAVMTLVAFAPFPSDKVSIFVDPYNFQVA